MSRRQKRERRRRRQVAASPRAGRARLATGAGIQEDDGAIAERLEPEVVTDVAA